MPRPKDMNKTDFPRTQNIHKTVLVFTACPPWSSPGHKEHRALSSSHYTSFYACLHSPCHKCELVCPLQIANCSFHMNDNVASSQIKKVILHYIMKGTAWPPCGGDVSAPSNSYRPRAVNCQSLAKMLCCELWLWCLTLSLHFLMWILWSTVMWISSFHFHLSPTFAHNFFSLKDMSL